MARRADRELYGLRRQYPAGRLLAIPESLPPKTTRLAELARPDPAQGDLF